MRSSAASKPGWLPAASSWARSGATAATSRRTGRPTGCTAKHGAAADLARQLPRPRYALAVGQRGAIDARLKQEMRRNTYDAASGTITVSRERAEAIRATAGALRRPVRQRRRARHAARPIRDEADALPQAADRKALTAFFFWSAWAAATDRPGRDRPVLHQQLAA